MSQRVSSTSHYNNRAALLGESAVASSVANMRKKDNSSASAEQARQAMEESNDREISQLSDKVAHMKNLAFDIEMQLQEDANLLNSSASAFDRVSVMMNSTLGNVNRMLSTGGSKHMCYLVLFIVCLFLGLYSLMK